MNDVCGPDQVGVTLLVCPLADESGGFRAERRQVDPRGPLGRVSMDQDLDHAAVGEDRLEEGVVHGVSGMAGTPRCRGCVGERMAEWADV